MAVNLSGGGYKSLGGMVRKSYRPMAEINVTPFIDVMLVLLIVFMVTAPLLSAGVQVDLPKTEAGAVQDKDNKPIEVSIKKDGSIFIGESEIQRTQLIDKLSAITENNKESRIFIKADQGLSYGQVMGVIGSVNKAGYGKVALITEPSTGSKR